MNEAIQQIKKQINTIELQQQSSSACTLKRFEDIQQEISKSPANKGNFIDAKVDPEQLDAKFTLIRNELSQELSQAILQERETNRKLKEDIEDLQRNLIEQQKNQVQDLNSMRNYIKDSFQDFMQKQQNEIEDMQSGQTMIQEKILARLSTLESAEADRSDENIPELYNSLKASLLAQAEAVDNKFESVGNAISQLEITCNAIQEEKVLLASAVKTIKDDNGTMMSKIGEAVKSQIMEYARRKEEEDTRRFTILGDQIQEFQNEIMELKQSMSTNIENQKVGERCFVLKQQSMNQSISLLENRVNGHEANTQELKALLAKKETLINDLEKKIKEQENEQNKVKIEHASQIADLKKESGILGKKLEEIPIKQSQFESELLKVQKEFTENCKIETEKNIKEFEQSYDKLKEFVESLTKDVTNKMQTLEENYAKTLSEIALLKTSKIIVPEAKYEQTKSEIILQVSTVDIKSPPPMEESIKPEVKSEVKLEILSEGKISENMPEIKTEIKPEGKSEIQSENISKNKSEEKSDVIKPEIKSEIKSEVKQDVVTEYIETPKQKPVENQESINQFSLSPLSPSANDSSKPVIPESLEPEKKENDGDEIVLSKVFNMKEEQEKSQESDKEKADSQVISDIDKEKREEHIKNAVEEWDFALSH